jgi:hypothetical protein
MILLGLWIDLIPATRLMLDATGGRNEERRSCRPDGKRYTRHGVKAPRTRRRPCGMATRGLHAIRAMEGWRAGDLARPGQGANAPGPRWRRSRSTPKVNGCITVLAARRRSDSASTAPWLTAATKVRWWRRSSCAISERAARVEINTSTRPRRVGKTCPPTPKKIGKIRRLREVCCRHILPDRMTRGLVCDFGPGIKRAGVASPHGKPPLFHSSQGLHKRSISLRAWPSRSRWRAWDWWRRGRASRSNPQVPSLVPTSCGS